MIEKIKKNKKYVTKRGITIYMTHFLYIILEYTINYIRALPRSIEGIKKAAPMVGPLFL